MKKKMLVASVALVATVGFASAMNPYGIENGMSGMNRDVFLKLVRCIRNDSKIKVLTAMCQEHFVRTKHHFFIKIRQDFIVGMRAECKRCVGAENTGLLTKILGENPALAHDLLRHIAPLLFNGNYKQMNQEVLKVLDAICTAHPTLATGILRQLTPLLDHAESWIVRSHKVAALGCIGAAHPTLATDIVQRITPLLGDNNEIVRSHTVAALRRIVRRIPG